MKNEIDYAVQIYDDFYKFETKREAIDFVNAQSGKFCELIENGKTIDTCYPL